MKKKLTALLTSLSFLLNCMPCVVVADEPEIVSSTYNHISWTLSDHVLTVSGEGEIPCERGVGKQENILPDWLDYSDEIETIIIEEGITSAQYRAFADLPNLRSITFPSGFEQLGTEALFNDENLYEINGLENVHYFDFRCLSNTGYINEHPFIINDGTLYYAEGTDFNVPEGVRNIAPFAFGNLTAYESTSSKAFNEIPYYDITLPEGLETIEKYAFAFSSRLCNINIPESVQSIGDYAFFSCPNLEEVTLSENCQEIGEFAFFNCRCMEKITIENDSMAMNFRSYGYCADWYTILVNRATEKGIDITTPQYEKMLDKIQNADVETLIDYDELANWTQLHYKTTRSFRYLAEGQYTDELSNAVIRNRDTVIRGRANSTAGNYAGANKLRFEALDDFLLGDVSQDGIVDVVDVLLLNQVNLGVRQITPIQRNSADFDRNGIVDDRDAVKILRYIVRLNN